MFLDGEVVLAEVGGPCRRSGGGRDGCRSWRDGFIDPDVVVVNGAVLEGVSLASACSGVEGEGAEAGSDVGASPARVRRKANGV